jgi:phage baseplate assembly protein W
VGAQAVYSSTQADTQYKCCQLILLQVKGTTMATKYHGFSTIDQVKKFKLTDFDLVKRDLLNHFSIRRGEKLLQPNFGSIIWNMLFEPLTEETKAILVEDIKRIVNYDPRINVNGVIIDQLENGLQIQVELLYLPTNMSDQLTLVFDNQSNSLSVS